MYRTPHVSLHKVKYVFKHATARHVRIFGFSQKLVLLKLVQPLKIFQNTKFHGRKLTGESFGFTSVV
jgi:hypothetical protein